MTPTEKHREMAKAVYSAVQDAEPMSRECREIIAAALAKAELEGMKSAAEIARGVEIREHDKWEKAERGSSDECLLHYAADTADEIRAAILSEAGKDE